MARTEVAPSPCGHAGRGAWFGVDTAKGEPLRYLTSDDAALSMVEEDVTAQQVWQASRHHRGTQ